MDTTTTEVQRPNGSPPATGDGGGTGMGRTYTQEEVHAKLKGQGAKLKAEAERARKLEEEIAKIKGTTDELRTAREAELAAALEERDRKIEELSGKWTAHIGKRQQSLKERLEKLPEDVRPASAKSLIKSTDEALLAAAEDLLAMAEATRQTPNVHGGGVRGDAIAQSDDARREAYQKAVAEKTFGKKGGAA